MREDNMTVEEFLRTYEIETDGLNYKSKRQLLKMIISHHKVDKDLEDLKYSKIPSEEKTPESRTEFVTRINNLDIKIINAVGYIAQINAIQKEERKLKRQNTLKKIFGKRN